MTQRRRLLVAAGGLVALAALAFGTATMVLLRDGTPRPLALPASSNPASPAASPESSQGAGTWTIATGSVAGYRVREQLASLPAPSDAVGRTSAVTGTMTLAQSAGGYTLTAAAFEVDVTSLTSDRAIRDQRIRVLGLESNRYPTATFKLTRPIALSAESASGQTIHLSAAGDLTIHGSTRPVTIPIDARLSGSQIEAVGAVTFPFSDFRMVPPSIGGFVSVQDNATVEFDLKLRQAD